MTKLGIDNFDPNDTHSVNISVYKPDGILSFWNWFTRRNKADGQRKNIKFKINKEDLEKMKLSGFDFQKLQNVDVSNKNKATPRQQCNVITVPKTDLDPFLARSLHPVVNTKTYVKRLISKSTISIRSKDSCANLKYIRTVRSQKSVVNSVQSSKTSFKVNMRSNTNVNPHSTHRPRNVFLKSVPTTVLQSNTKKLLVLGKVKSPKTNRTTRTNNVPENLNIPQSKKDDFNAIPMLLTRMKSMEEQLSDIENTTKKINEAVSSRNNIKKIPSQNGLSNTERNRQKAIKCVTSHKIYSKNIHAPRKHKKNRAKKQKNKSKTNISTPNEASLKFKPPNKGFTFNYFSDSSNEFKNNVGAGHNENINHSDARSFFNQHGFILPNNISKIEFCPENNSNVGCDLIMSVVKALTETKGSTNLQRIDSPMVQNVPQHRPNISSEVGVVNLGESSFMSKSTFDWKHLSVSRSSEPRISENNQENIKVKKNISVTFGNQDESQETNLSNQICLNKEIVLELLRNGTGTSLAEPDETKAVAGTPNCRAVNPLGAIEPHNKNLEVTEGKQRNNNDGDNEDPESEFQEKASTQTYSSKHNSTNSTKTTESPKETDKLSLEPEQNRSAGNDNRFQERNTLTDVVECTEKRPLDLMSCGDTSSEITIDRGALCSVSIKQNSVSAAFASTPEKQFKRTTISCSNAKKEPKVSITILVQDSMKDDVEMKSSMLKNLAVSKIERIDKLSMKGEEFPPLSSVGPRGDQLTAQSSMCCKTDSLCSLGSVSCTLPDNKVPVPKITVQQTSNSRTNKNFYIEVEDEVKQTFADEDLNLGSPGTYLNREKRKVLEEKVLGYKQTKPLVRKVYEKEPLSPTRSCSNISNGLASFDHLIETSFIRQETSYSKTKFNICKENNYNSRTLLKPLESRKRCPFSDESLSTENNNFDISTKYTSQQCVMYCRNNNVANFKRSKFPLFKEKSSENTEFNKIKQPFMVAHTPNNSRDNTVVNKNNKILKEWQKGTGLDIREDAILEVSEGESFSELRGLNEHEIVAESEIEIIKTSHESIRSNLDLNCRNDIADSRSDKKVLDDKDSLTKKELIVKVGGGKAQSGVRVATETSLRTSIKCACDLPDVETLDASLTTNEPRTRIEAVTPTSRISQTVLSSTLVQTDWSLVGITVDHLNCSNRRSESASCKKRTVASQTDVMMDQIALMNKDLEDIHSCCKSCKNSCQFSELVACNVNVTRVENSQEGSKNVLDNKEVVVPSNYKKNLKEMISADVFAALIEDKESNCLKYTATVLPINEDVLECELLENVQMPTLLNSSRLNLTSQYYRYKSEESLETVIDEILPHRCTIPCFTTLSDETMASSLSESSNKIICGGISDFHAVPHIHAINRGIYSYYNQSGERHVHRQLSPIEESRPSTGDSNFCRVIRNFDEDIEESSQDGNYTESRTSLDATEAVKDSIVEQLNEILDRPDGLEDKNKECVGETRPGHAPVTKKTQENSKAKERKICFKNCTPRKTRTKDCSSFDKCTDNIINYLSIDRCDDERKGILHKLEYNIGGKEKTAGRDNEWTWGKVG